MSTEDNVVKLKKPFKQGREATAKDVPQLMDDVFTLMQRKNVPMAGAMTVLSCALAHAIAYHAEDEKHLIKGIYNASAGISEEAKRLYKKYEALRSHTAQ